ncbi:MAG TPA: class I SAM-dependent rRNA methyltransferase [Polyangiaceae bacterium]|nr:class I SAM-dependent rRNA methyltransferase [Polyangiaceae bacterium]
MAIVRLKAGHVRPVWAGHPWVFAQAVARVEGGATAGDEVDVVDPQGRFLGRGLYSPSSAIVVRIFARQPNVALDRALLERRIEAAARRRSALGLGGPDTTGYRLVHAEGDALPGLVVDRFDGALAFQLGTIGMKRREAAILEALERVGGGATLIDRTSPAVARLEGFVAGGGVVRGDPSVRELRCREGGIELRIPLELGQKTGFYFDQRPLRARVEELATGRRVLDAFAFVGAVGLRAARGGATEVIAVERNALALEVGAELARLNGLSDRLRFVHGDARETLAQAGRRGGYDLVVCDPPKLAPNAAARRRAESYLRELAATACRATRPGGMLVLSSCSAALGIEEVTRAVATGGAEVGVRPVVVERLFQGPDHPVPAAFPEGLYLSTVIAELPPP